MTEISVSGKAECLVAKYKDKNVTFNFGVTCSLTPLTRTTTEVAVRFKS